MIRVCILVSIVLSACSGPSKTGGGGPIGAGGNDTPPVASPGLLSVAAASPTFKQALAFADKGDLHAAIAAFWRVKAGETGDADAIRTVATYNIATLALERGWYDIAAQIYREVIQDDVPELAGECVGGLAAIFDRLEDADLVSEAIGLLPAGTLEDGRADLRPHVTYFQAQHAYRSGSFEKALALARTIPADWKYASLVANLTASTTLRMTPAESGDERRIAQIRSKLLRLEGAPWKRAALTRDRVAYQKAQLDASVSELGEAADDFRLHLEFALDEATKWCGRLLERIDQEHAAAAKDPELFPVTQPCAPPASWAAPRLVTRSPTRTISISTVAAKPVEAPPPDRDGDGVADADDKCPAVAGSQNGCPGDRDGDGVADASDRCPGIAGDKSNQGCPVEKDSDGDGLLDSKDDCKADAGLPTLNGCPDGDSDGIADRYDACPAIKGTVKAGPYIGCAPRANPKCTAPKSKAAKPTGYQCGYGKPKVGVGCACPGGQTSVLVDEDIAVCWVPPPGC